MHVHRAMLGTGEQSGDAMKTPDNTNEFGIGRVGRIGITEVISAYGIDEVRRRIEDLRVNGRAYAATAIERELAARPCP